MFTQLTEDFPKKFRPLIAHACGIRLIADSLKVHAREVAVQIAALRCARALIVDDRVMQAEFHEVGGIGLCLAALFTHRSHHAVEGWACAVLRCLVPLSTTDQIEMTRVGIFTAMLSVLNREIHTVDTKRDRAENGQVTDANIKNAEDASALKPHVEPRSPKCTTHVFTQIVIVESALRVLRSLLLAKQNKWQFIKSGGLGTVVYALTWACNFGHSSISCAALQLLYDVSLSEKPRTVLRDHYRKDLRHVFNVTDPDTHYGGSGDMEIRELATKLLVRLEIISENFYAYLHKYHSLHFSFFLHKSLRKISRSPALAWPILTR